MHVDSSDGFVCTVTLDGQDISDICVAADEEEGWAEVYEVTQLRPVGPRTARLSNGVLAKQWLQWTASGPEAPPQWAEVRWCDVDPTCPRDLQGVARTVAYGRVTILLTGRKLVHA